MESKTNYMKKEQEQQGRQDKNRALEPDKLLKCCAFILAPDEAIVLKFLLGNVIVIVIVTTAWCPSYTSKKPKSAKLKNLSILILLCHVPCLHLMLSSSEGRNWLCPIVESNSWAGTNCAPFQVWAPADAGANPPHYSNSQGCGCIVIIPNLADVLVSLGLCSDSTHLNLGSFTKGRCGATILF